jgi:hypothetical protein
MCFATDELSHFINQKHDALPLGATGKVLKRDLRDQFADILMG